MQVKNASFFQLHIEKIVLAAGVFFLLIAVAVVVFGVVLKPYQVELGNATYDDPAEVIPVLEEKADRLVGDLQKTGEPVPASVPEGYSVPDLGTNYEQMIEQPVVEATPFAPLALGGLDVSALDRNPPPPPTYVLPTPPMVADMEYKHGFEVLDREERELAQAYFELWGSPRAPADFSYVFVEGTFDIGDWVERLQATPAEGNMVPLGIWSGKLGLATVYLIREQRDPVTGAWTEQTVVPLLPDQAGVVPGEAMPSAVADAEAIIDWLLIRQADIAQPVPPPLANNGELLPPLDDPMMLISQEELDAMADAERAEERARRRAEQEAARAQRAAERDARRNNGGGGGNVGPGGFPGGGGPDGSSGRGGSRGGRGGASSGGSSSNRDTGRPGRSGIEQPPPDPRGGNSRTGGRDGDPLLGGPNGLGGRGNNNTGEPEDPNKLRVWAVDVTVVPGTVYRYKLIVGVINPLYGVARLEAAQLSENQSRVALTPSQEELDLAPWIEPVEIEPNNRFFVVSANDRGARVNVWRVHNGERIKEQFDVNPGDPIGGLVSIQDEDGINHDVDMLVGATVVDIDRRRDINGQTVWTLIYIDDYGNLHERPLSDDQSASSQFERRLREEREARERAMDMLPGNGGREGVGPGGFDPLGPGGPGFSPDGPGFQDRTGR